MEGREFLAGEPYGSRGKIGLINVGGNPTPVVDFYRMIPPGVIVNENKIHEPPQVAGEAEELGKRAIEAAKVIAEGGPDVIAFTCTASAMSVGPEADYDQIKWMQDASGGIPCTTTTTGILNAFKLLGWKKMVMVSPYLQPIVDKFVKTLTVKGYTVLKSGTLAIEFLEELRRTPTEKSYKLALQTVVPEADGIFIPCTTFRVIDIIDRLEKETGKTVITSNQASLWECLRLLKIDDPIPGFGKLLMLPNRSAFKGFPR
jgi:maleate isomerase